MTKFLTVLMAALLLPALALAAGPCAPGFDCTDEVHSKKVQEQELEAAAELLPTELPDSANKQVRAASGSSVSARKRPERFTTLKRDEALRAKGIHDGCPAGFDCTNDFSETFDAGFVVVNGLRTASVLWDVKSTFDGRDRCPTCEEAHPILKPFVEHFGEGPTYAVMMGIDYLAWRSTYSLKKKGKWYWWVPSVLMTGLHILAAQSNNSH